MVMYEKYGITENAIELKLEKVTDRHWYTHMTYRFSLSLNYDEVVAGLIKFIEVDVMGEVLKDIDPDKTLRDPTITIWRWKLGQVEHECGMEQNNLENALIRRFEKRFRSGSVIKLGFGDRQIYSQDNRRSLFSKTQRHKRHRK